MMTKLKDFLEKHGAWESIYDFAKDLTLEQFLDTCERGDWILWLFQKSNPESIRELTLAKGHCAATVLHLMKDQRSKDAVQTAIDFGMGKINKERMKTATASSDAIEAIEVLCANGHASTSAIISCTIAAATNVLDNDAAAVAELAAFASSAADAKAKNQLETARICVRDLPIDIWNIYKKGN